MNKKKHGIVKGPKQVKPEESLYLPMVAFGDAVTRLAEMERGNALLPAWIICQESGRQWAARVQGGK